MNSAATKAKAVALYGHGMTCATIAERLGVSRTSVQNWLRSAGIEIDLSRRFYAGTGNASFRAGRKATSLLASSKERS